MVLKGELKGLKMAFDEEMLYSSRMIVSFSNMQDTNSAYLRALMVPITSFHTEALQKPSFCYDFIGLQCASAQFQLPYVDWNTETKG